MNQLPVIVVPRRKSRYNLLDLIEDFVSSGYCVARLLYGEPGYKTRVSARNSVASAVKRSNRKILVMLRGDQIYLGRNFS